jgi:hypothetical protein
MFASGTHNALLDAVNPRAILPHVACMALVACGGSSTTLNPTDAGGEGSAVGPDGGGISAAQAVSDAANAYCNRVNSCAPAYGTLAFGTTATCVTRLSMELTSQLSAPGTSSSPAQAEACAKALPTTACGDLLARKTPAACQTLPGMLAAGAACAIDAQCIGTRCRVPPNMLCGTCTTPAPAGANCSVDDDCQPDMTCVNETCVQYGDEGATCSTNLPCRPDLGCVGGMCGTPSANGVTCASSAECDQLNGSFCNPLSKQCGTVGFAPASGPCGLVDGGISVCAGPGSLCGNETAPSYQGKCVGFAMDGANCDADAGPLCDVGAVCSGGMCQLPNPASCK